MDLGTELDYEEEDSKQIDDEYLRIDLSEEEENFFTGEPLGETASVKNRNIPKVNKKGEGSCQQNTTPDKQQFAQTNTVGESNSDYPSITVKNVQKKNCQLQTELKINKTITQSPNCSLQEEKLPLSQNVVKPPVLSVFNRLGQSQGFCLNQNTTIQPLMSLNAVIPEQCLHQLRSKRFRPVQTFSSNSSCRFPVSSQNLFQQRNEPVVCHSSPGFNNGYPKFANGERKRFCARPTCADVQPKVMVQEEHNKRIDISPKPKPDISKELLLKKRNPFDTKVELPVHTPIIKVKDEYLESKLFSPDIVHQRLKEEDRSSLPPESSPCTGFYTVKADADSPVKFVRTVSKSLDELTQRNGYPRGLPQPHLRTFPLVQGNLRTPTSEDSPQVRYQVLSRIF